ncbi:MAG: GatB/YqeY domain-containing protein [Gammaproteobacteria bacterium]|nr:MAG: GatB/YqeY domain-containing protein [Gammaproteobacteria bacterium]
MSLKTQVSDDMKSALRGGEKLRLTTIRMLLAAIKQREVDERRELSDGDILQVVEKLIKQRREAATQFKSAGRNDLEARELEETRILSVYLPVQLTESEIRALLDAAIAESGAASMKDMGKVMNVLRPRLQGRADMAQVSALLKAKLAG